MDSTHKVTLHLDCDIITPCEECKKAEEDERVKRMQGQAEWYGEHGRDP